MNKRVVAITMAMLLVLTAVFSACGKKDDTSSSVATEPAASSVAEPAEPPYTPNPLTGLENKSEYPEGKRFAAVMINNIAGNGANNARPQWGISTADVLVEIKVEGGITRLMGLFADYANMPQVGPVRSARDQFFQLILPYQPLYIHIGESTVQSEFRTNYEYGLLDINLDKYSFPRDQARLNTGVNVEHTAYTNGELISGIVQKNNIDDNRTYSSPIFNFENYNNGERAITGDNAVQVSIVHSQTYRTYFDYDEASQQYLMSQYSSLKGAVHETIDANNNERVKFKNLLVMFGDIATHPNYVNEHYDIQKVDYAAGGLGFYFCNGKVEQVTWSKPTPQSVMEIFSKTTGEAITINPGKTYLGVVDYDEAANFTYDTGLSGDSTDAKDIVVTPDSTNTEFVDE
ncbi:MAG: DUF3048 domain-containing protein [Clostridia bacterium]|nr:DUF3048 domain-containing protein [Clostridia bacterium]